MAIAAWLPDTRFRHAPRNTRDATRRREELYPPGAVRWVSFGVTANSTAEWNNPVVLPRNSAGRFGTDERRVGKVLPRTEARMTLFVGFSDDRRPFFPVL